MITSIAQVNEEFFRLFSTFSKKADFRYAKSPSYDYAEAGVPQRYPCIAIQDYPPTLRDDWYVDQKKYFDHSEGEEGHIFSRPLWMQFKYDVSIASKGYKEFTELCNSFNQKFKYETYFHFHKEGTEIDDYCPYTFNEADIPRTDGVFERNFEFTLSVWVYPQEGETVELVEKLAILAEPTQTI